MKRHPLAPPPPEGLSPAARAGWRLLAPRVPREGHLLLEGGLRAWDIAEQHREAQNGEFRGPRCELNRAAIVNAELAARRLILATWVALGLAGGGNAVMAVRSDSPESPTH